MASLRSSRSRLALVGVVDHRAELQARERRRRPCRGASSGRAPVRASPPSIASAITRQQRAQHDQAERREEQVEGPLEHEVEALEDRRAQLEERHRLPGDELRVVDEHLHRRGRDAHAHAPRVGAVDELEQLLLGVVVVGDDHLVDALRARSRGRSRRACRAIARAPAVRGARSDTSRRPRPTAPGRRRARGRRPRRARPSRRARARRR